MDRPHIALDAAIVGVDVGLLPAYINGVACWVLRTDKNNRGIGDHALDIIELVAPVHLRTVLNLHDGDPVVVDVNEADT